PHRPMRARRRTALGSGGRGRMTLATGRSELAGWLTSAAFNAYFGFRLRAFGAGEGTIAAPVRPAVQRPGRAISTVRGTRERWVTADLKTTFLRAARREPFAYTAHVLKIGRQVAYVVAECARQDGTPLTHHTGIYVRIPERARLSLPGK